MLFTTSQTLSFSHLSFPFCLCSFFPSCLSLLSLLFFLFSVCVSLPFLDLDKMDSEKDEMNQTDIAALHHFYSRHISDLPDKQALTELFAQVTFNNTMSFKIKNLLFREGSRILGWLCVLSLSYDWLGKVCGRTCWVIHKRFRHAVCKYMHA